MIRKTTVITALVALPCTLWAVAQLHVSVDAGALKQAEIAVRDSQQEGNSAATIRAYRRWLEFYPNEPSIQAEIYRALATLFEQEGDAEQARLWSGAAESLDPAQGGSPQANGATTRGSADKLAAILAAVNQSAQAVQTIRQTLNAANPGPGAAAVPGPVAAVPFPAQPVGSPGYQPVAVTQSMPGYAPEPQFVPQQAQPQPVPLDAQGNPIPQPAPQPIQPMALDAQGNPVPQPIQPVVQPQPQQVQYAQQQPQPLRQYPQQQPQPQQVQYAQQQTGPQSMQQYPQQKAQRPQQYARQRATYGVPVGYARPQQTRRGEAAQAIRVFHDHSRLGDTNYFEPPCGALLLAENGGLTFTSTGGEAPLVIPASEILEIRMNTAVAKEAGAFHIITKSGLYLGLAPQGATADEGRADVDELRRQLGLDR